MTARANKVSETVRILMDLLQQETRALKERSIAELAEIADEKRALADRLETALTQPQEAPNAATRRDLERLQILCAENASRLAALRDSIARARARLETILAEERSAGLYGAHGKGRFGVRTAAGRNA